jgi:hypothetical protein
MTNSPRRLPQTGPLGRKDPPREKTLPPQIHFSHRATRAPSHLLIQIAGSEGMVTTIGLAVKSRLVVGRGDPTTNFAPDLDLAPYAAQDAGVSRQHIFIVRDEGLLYVQDNQSKNGTSLNHQKLEPGEIHPLHDGDIIGLGRLALTIYFVYKPK